MDEQLSRIRDAYDRTVEQFERGIDPLDDVAADLKDSVGFQEFLAEAGKWCNVGAPDVRPYLAPETGMRFLDLGCSAGLLNHSLHEWPSTYYGLDISTALIGAMRRFVTADSIRIGGLTVSDAANIPYPDGHFDIAALIGVLEYCNLDYVKRAIVELRRVLVDGARVIVDIPNEEHRHAELMFRLEACLGRPQQTHGRLAFEDHLERFFTVEHTDESRVMLRYFCVADARH